MNVSPFDSVLLFSLLVATIVVGMQVLAGRFDRFMPEVVSHVPKVQRRVRHSGASGMSQPVRGGTGELIGARSVAIASLANFV